MSLGDNSTRYGTISRLLHWSMALLLLIQFASARSFEPFGLPLFAGFEGEEIAWLVVAGDDRRPHRHGGGPSTQPGAHRCVAAHAGARLLTPVPGDRP